MGRLLSSTLHGDDGVTFLFLLSVADVVPRVWAGCEIAFRPQAQASCRGPQPAFSVHWDPSKCDRGARGEISFFLFCFLLLTIFSFFFVFLLAVLLGHCRLSLVVYAPTSSACNYRGPNILCNDL